MTHDEYLAMKIQRDALAKSIIHFIGEQNHLLVEQLMTLTRILDRAAAHYARCREYGDVDMGFLPSGHEIDYQNGD